MRRRECSVACLLRPMFESIVLDMFVKSRREKMKWLLMKSAAV